ncbi:MAG: hypothetical protein GC178_00580 [Flavobacteriales bacterium]|nr:hypothetical protein [Flavobacteriales bacterium]
MTKIIGPKSYFDFSAPTIMGANLRTWFQFLWRYGKHINWKFYPKLFAITFMICLYAPVRWWERLRFDRKIRETKVKSPVFILGHQRSGTTYLHYLLGRDPQFGYLSVKESFMPWIYLTAKRHLEWMLGRSVPTKRPMDDLRLGLDLPTEPEYALGNMTVSTMLAGYMLPSQLKSVFRKTVLFEDEQAKKEWIATLKYSMQKLTLLHGGKPILTKAPEDLGRVKEILEVFPDAKFVHIFRDPYRVYFSTERLYEITLPLVALEYVADDVVKDFIVYAYREMFNRYFEAKKLIPQGNLVEIKYEDFIGNEMETLRAAYQTLGLDFESAAPHIKKEVKSYEGYQTNKYEFDPHRMEEIYSAWEGVFKKLGYEQ